MCCNCWNGPWSHLVPWLFWSPRNLIPEKFGPLEIWAPRNLVPAWKSLYTIFMQGPTFLGPKFLRDQSSHGPNFLGTKKVRGPNEIGDYFSYSPDFQYVLRKSICSRLEFTTREGKKKWFLIGLCIDLWRLSLAEIMQICTYLCK